MNPVRELYQKFLGLFEEGYVTDHEFDAMCEGAMCKPLDPEALKALEPLLVVAQMRVILLRLKQALEHCASLKLQEFIEILQAEINPSEFKNVA